MIMPNTCTCCKFVEVKANNIGLKSYYCKLIPGLLVGEFDYLTGYRVMEACDKFVCFDGKEEEEEEKDKGEV